MGFLFLILVFLCWYFWNQNIRLNKRNSELIKKQKEERAMLESRKSVKQNQQSLKSREKETPQKKSIGLDSSECDTAVKTFVPTKYPRFNSGIAEIDGPGVWHRLHQYPKGEALYLLFSKAHNAYKIGISEPDRLPKRINDIREEVPDAILDGLSVFTSRQNAFVKEQEITKRYSKSKYFGITGRSSGISEWLTVRPTGKPHLLKPKEIEERFEKQINSPAEALEIPDNYTVYLMYSQSKNLYKCSWCKSSNLKNKINNAKLEMSDAQLISRIKIETREKARAIAKSKNEMSSSFKKDGRKEIYEWCLKPSYLNDFKNWDENGENI